MMSDTIQYTRPNSNNNNMLSWQLTSLHIQLLKEYNHLDMSSMIEKNQYIVTGLTSDEVQRCRDINDIDNDDTVRNIIPPPIQCPAWICCLLPCIYHINSMKIYKEIIPEDAEILRNDVWIRYDASSIVERDIIRLYPGDRIPADCIIIQHCNNNNDKEELLVDMKYITGDINIQSIRYNNNNDSSSSSNIILYCGGLIIHGTVIAIVIAIGLQTKMSQLIQFKQFPIKKITSSTLNASTTTDQQISTTIMTLNDIENNKNTNNDNDPHHRGRNYDNNTNTDHIALLQYRTKSKSPSPIPSLT